MRIKFLRGTALGGIGNDAAPGDERELPDHQALAFIAQGRAIRFGDGPTAAAPPNLPAAELQTSAPAAPHKKGRK